MQTYYCRICGYVYDPDVGDLVNGVKTGTRFEEIPEKWVCPICGAGKTMFDPYD